MDISKSGKYTGKDKALPEKLRWHGKLLQGGVVEICIGIQPAGF